MSSETSPDWPSITLSNLIASLDAGVSVNSEGRRCNASEIGVLKTSSVSAGRFNPAEHKAVLNGERGRVRVAVKADSIILSRMNTPDLVGENAYVDADYPDLYLPDRLWLLRTTGKADCRWLSFFMQSEFFRRQLDDIATGTSGSMKNISKARLAELSLLLPSLDEQRRIAEVLRAMDEAILAAQAEAETAERVFTSVRDELIGNARAEFDEVTVAETLAKNRGEKLRKLQTAAYQDEGVFPIVDQGADFICGYTDDADALWPYSLPVIVFGDHTLALKFVDFPFVIGADGTQCLTTKEGILARYLYYAIQSLDLSSEGYARHFKLLKEKAIPLPDEQTQMDMVAVLISLERAHEGALSCIHQAEAIKKAVAHDLLSGRVRVPA